MLEDVDVAVKSEDRLCIMSPVVGVCDIQKMYKIQIMNNYANQ